MLDVLLRNWCDSPRSLSDALYEHTGVSCIDAGEAFQPRHDLMSPEAFSNREAVLVEASNGELLLAAVDPWDASRVRACTRGLRKPVKVCASTCSFIDRMLGRELAAASLENGSPAADPDATGVIGNGELSGPAVSFVDAALRSAILQGVSDVHFESSRKGIQVKFRKDGVIQPFSSLEREGIALEVVSRIKVMSHLDITERRIPQDGRCRFEYVEGATDLRVSVMPSIHGEDVVVRVLDKRRFSVDSEISLAALGFSNQDADAIRYMSSQPNGMMLVTGPTGSGKTTTLYAVISEIKDGLSKIVTIEDPVEYELEGVLQIPVNEKKGLNFANGLRSILRHDPDQILVGEIRDSETAEIAVQASLTGHQVFTTVHANSVSDIVGRFRHFGIDTFGFASALNGIVVQRLVRRLCPHCARQEVTSNKVCSLFEQYGMDPNAPLFAPVGCEYCNGGYSGRTVVIEIHQVTDEFRDLVVEGVSLGELKDYYLRHQIRSLMERGLAYVSQGVTSIEELRRVVGNF